MDTKCWWKQQVLRRLDAEGWWKQQLLRRLDAERRFGGGVCAAQLAEAAVFSEGGRVG
ncbi:hypothetical protein LQV63_14475 [Paenibacillus profundus]|uniref:Uncharacterized protein n=1 Tax=Paenibacillus profundus TaxID=1173085 RepID=A0ABS8YEU2_9BACL|nr:hypothetical protein [Paenibacillus profundus]